MPILKTIQNHTGLARGEAIVATTITVLLVGGWIGERLFPADRTHEIQSTRRVIALLDSMQRSVDRSKPEKTREDSISMPVSTERRATPQQAAAIRVNVNTASKALLERLPGVGPAMAERILEERSRQKFSSVDDLDRVKGIGPKKLEKMRPYVIAP